MDSSLPNSKSRHSPNERTKIKRVVIDRGLTGLANDTKWDELIEFMRGRKGWTPSYRFKCVDGPISAWDTEWYYHLPFPMISVEWFDIAFIQIERPHRLLDPVVTDHSAWIEAALAEIGLEYQLGESMIRVFGYAPRSSQAFDT